MANPVMWFEIIGKDSVGLQKFYRDVFGWKLTPPVKEMGNYSMLERPDTGIGAQEVDRGTRSQIDRSTEEADPAQLASDARTCRLSSSLRDSPSA